MDTEEWGPEMLTNVYSVGGVYQSTYISKIVLPKYILFIITIPAFSEDYILCVIWLFLYKMHPSI